jgi:hypothetical protein
VTDTFERVVKRINAERWFSVFESEYLRDFVPSGGSVVRFLSGDAETLELACTRLRHLAQERAFWCRFLDPAEVDATGRAATLHKIESFFKAVTAEHDWSALVEDQLRSFLATKGISIAAPTGDVDLAAVAQANDREVGDLAREIRRFGAEMIRDPLMATEFRLALAALAKERILRESGSPSLEHVILEWLAGRTVPGGAKILKSVGVFDRIKATTARAMLISFMRWLRRQGTPGAIVVLDFRPYQNKRLTATQKRQARDDAMRDALRRGATHEELELILDEPADDAAIFFSDKAFLQMLDLLRHFIDDVESFPGLALVILTTDAFYDGASPRNYMMYNALQTRIGQEVRDAAHPNPVAMLVHIGGEA